MLLGCCHCGEEPPSESTPPSESIPPSDSESESQSESGSSESGSSESIELYFDSCIANIGCPAVPRYLRWHLDPGGNLHCLAPFYVGDFKLELCSCQYAGVNNWTLVYVTKTRGKASFVTSGVCTGNDAYTGPVSCSDYGSAASMRYYAIIYRIPANAFAKVTVRAQAANVPTPSSPYNFHWGSPVNLAGKETYDPCMFTPVTLTQQTVGIAPIGAATGVLSPW